MCAIFCFLSFSQAQQTNNNNNNNDTKANDDDDNDEFDFDAFAKQAEAAAAAAGDNDFNFGDDDDDAEERPSFAAGMLRDDERAFFSALESPDGPILRFSDVFGENLCDYCCFCFVLFQHCLKK
jgi:hypothetical protein